jgi:hypothetical protein
LISKESQLNYQLKKLSYHIKERSLIARLAAWKLNCNKVAIVIGQSIHLHNTKQQEFLADKRWLLHELKHLEQFKRYGLMRFIFLYIWESIRHGYTNNKYEIEARAAEKDEQLLERMELADKQKNKIYRE